MRNVLNRILKNLIKLNPVSTALTGSSVNREGGKNSDVEMAVVFNDKNYVMRRDLKKFASGKIRIYPFKSKEITKLKGRSPFPRKFYFYWLSKNSQTLYGESILEKVNIRLTKKDLKEVIDFERGVALYAMLSFRSGDRETAHWGFSKSCLFATAAAIGMQGKTPPCFLQRNRYQREEIVSKPAGTYYKSRKNT